MASLSEVGRRNEILAFQRWRWSKPTAVLRNLQAELAAKQAKREIARQGRKRGRDLRRERNLLNRAYFVEKLGGGCVDCGYNEKLYALDFDHIDPATKSCDLSSIMGGMDRDAIWQEVQKCELRCALHHRIRSVELGHLGGKRKKTS